MNALELADELLYRYADEGGKFDDDDIHIDVVEMLRQQALEIDFLKGQLEVADELTKMRLRNSANPVKELTDEEIEIIDSELPKEFSPHGWGMPWENFLVSVRAILKKASEK